MPSFLWWLSYYFSLSLLRTLNNGRTSFYSFSLDLCFVFYYYTGYCYSLQDLSWRQLKLQLLDMLETLQQVQTSIHVPMVFNFAFVLHFPSFKFCVIIIVIWYILYLFWIVLIHQELYVSYDSQILGLLYISVLIKRINLIQQK